jgi:peptidoglycan/LPS O-acetylase OafA/YrhL
MTPLTAMSDEVLTNEVVPSLKPNWTELPVINNIQAMRGIASIIVFIGHACLLQPGLGLDRFFPFLGVTASTGVDIFFVISGFIITTVAMKSGMNSTVGNGTTAWNFGIKRVTRIYPVYWLVFALTCVLTPIVQYSPDFVVRMPVVQQALLLTHVNSHIMAAWSLCFEIYFYAVVVVALLVSPRHVGRVLSFWAVSITSVIAYDYFIGQRGWIGLVPMSPLVFEFIFGMLVAYLISRRITGFGVTAGFIGIVALMAGLEIMRLRDWSSLNPWWRTIFAGIPSAFIVYSVIALEYRKIWTFSPLWVHLGDASYSIYIWHQFIFYTILKIFVLAGLIGRVPGLLLMAGWMIPAFLIGIASYKHIEIPLQRKLNERLLIRPRKTI